MCHLSLQELSPYNELQIRAKDTILGPAHYSEDEGDAEDDQVSTMSLESPTPEQSNWVLSSSEQMERRIERVSKAWDEHCWNDGAVGKHKHHIPAQWQVVGDERWPSGKYMYSTGDPVTVNVGKRV